jgi:hypothetical protein
MSSYPQERRIVDNLGVPFFGFQQPRGEASMAQNGLQGFSSGLFKKN